MRYKIALHGFGAAPLIFKHLIEIAAKDEAPIDWCMILPNPEHRELARSLLPNSEILDVYQALPRIPVGGDISVLADYPGSLAEDIRGPTSGLGGPRDVGDLRAAWTITCSISVSCRSAAPRI